MTDLLTLAREVGFSQCAAVNMDALDPLEAVRDMCAADRCDRYGILNAKIEEATAAGCKVSLRLELPARLQHTRAGKGANQALFTGDFGAEHRAARG